MTTPAGIERKVRQLENDVLSIYELLNGISTTQVRHGSRLDDVDQKLARIAGTQARHGNRLDELDQRFDEVDQRFDRMDQKVDGVDQKVDQLDVKLDRVIELLGGKPQEE